MPATCQTQPNNHSFDSVQIRESAGSVTVTRRLLT
jgi:hypothetical protein